MTMFRLDWRLILLFLTFLSFSLAANPTSFCKCTCFSNSTIIPLSSTPSENNSPAKPPSLFGLRSPADPSKQPPPHRSCADCTKQFCLSYNLPICSKAKEEDVLTACFQRDSAKDQAVVLLFIGATVSLLIWAAVRPAYERWRERRGYNTVGSGGG